MNNLLDDYALSSPLRYSSNLLKLTAVTVGVLGGISAASPLAPLFIAACMVFASVVLGKVPVKFFLKLIAIPLGFAATGSVVILFFSGSGHELASIDILGHHLAIRSQGMDMAVLVMARTLSGMCCLFFLALSTPVVELFSALKSSGMPDVVIELSMLIYRYIFVLLEVAVSIKFAQTVRLGYKDLLSSLHSTAMLAGSLFIRSWEQAERLYIAMDSRCYNGKLSMSSPRKQVRAPELLLTSFYVISIIAISFTAKNIPLV